MGHLVKLIKTRLLCGIGKRDARDSLAIGHDNLIPNPNAYHSLSVMPTVISRHPVAKFETLDSRVQTFVVTRLAL